MQLAHVRLQPWFYRLNIYFGQLLGHTEAAECLVAFKESLFRRWMMGLYWENSTLHFSCFCYFAFAFSYKNKIKFGIVSDKLSTEGFIYLLFSLDSITMIVTLYIIRKLESSKKKKKTLKQLEQGLSPDKNYPIDRVITKKILDS